MVHGEQQHMLVVCEPNQPAADQRPLFKVEGGACLDPGETIQLCLRVVMFTKIMFEKNKPAVLDRCDPLARLPIDESEGGAQSLVPGPYPVQSTAQGRAVEIALQ